MAIPFIHPAIFWTGLAAASVPIIIHLLNRRRFKVHRWAAMKFLLDAMRKNRRRIQMEELLLLLVRTLALLLLAAGIARFTGCGVMDVIPGTGTTATATVFVLDDSYSMGQKTGASSVFSVAVSDLAEQLRKIPSGDRVEIILASMPDQPFFAMSNITEPESLIAKVQSLTPSDRRTFLSESLAAAAKTFGDVKENKRLFIMADFRKVDLPARELGPEPLKKAFKDLSDAHVNIVALGYGRECKNNLTITAFEMVDRYAAAGRPTRLAVSVRNNGATVVDNVEVRLSAKYQLDPQASNDRFENVSLPVQTIKSIEPGKTQRIEFDVTPPHAGFSAVTAAIPEDELSTDNSASLSLQVKDAIRVLVVDGRPDMINPLDSESVFFRVAIDPELNGSFGCRPEVISVEAAPAVKIDDYDLVVLMNVRELPVVSGALAAESAPASMPVSGMVCPLVKSLEEYVRSGGGLMIFTGDRVNPMFYNEYMFGSGAGLLPLKFGATVGSVTDKKKRYRIDPASVSVDRIISTFQGKKVAILDGINFQMFTKVDESLSGSNEVAKTPLVLARFDDQKQGQGSPAIVYRQYGRGGVVVVCSTGSARWNDWPQDPVGTYAAFLQDVFLNIARSQKQYTDYVGVKLKYDQPDDLRDAKVALTTPKYPKIDVIPLVADRDSSGKVQYQYNDAVYSGLYTMTFTLPGGAVKDAFFARNCVPLEGDLTPGGNEDLLAASGSQKFQYVSRSSAQAGQMVQSGDEKEYWLIAIVAALLMLTAETFLAQRFGHYSK